MRLSFEEKHLFNVVSELPRPGLCGFRNAVSNPAGKEVLAKPIHDPGRATDQPNGICLEQLEPDLLRSNQLLGT